MKSARRIATNVLKSQLRRTAVRAIAAVVDGRVPGTPGPKAHGNSIKRDTLVMSFCSRTQLFVCTLH